MPPNGLKSLPNPCLSLIVDRFKLYPKNDRLPEKTDPKKKGAAKLSSLIIDKRKGYHRLRWSETMSSRTKQMREAGKEKCMTVVPVRINTHDFS